MEVIIQNTAEQAAQLVADLIALDLQAKPALVLGLATGRTMESVYRALVRKHKKDGLSFDRCRTFNLDEYVGIPAGHPGSYRHYMNKCLFDHVDIKLRNTHLPLGMARDLGAECRKYEELIRKSGGIDFQLLGIGSDGHIGFNEPLSAFRSRTREKALTRSTLKQNAAMFGGNPDKVPRRALTMGVGTILESRRCVMLVTGKPKASILARTVEGPITSMISATALQLHQRCTVVVDEAAASRLSEVEYYRWTFQNEPEWQEFRARRSS